MIHYVWGTVYGRRRARELFPKENVQFLSFFSCSLVNRWGNLPQALNWLSGSPEEIRRGCCSPYPTVHTHNHICSGSWSAPRVGADSQCSERGRAGFPGWGSTVHAEKREIKNTAVLGPQAAVCGRTDEKKFDCGDRRDHPPRRCAVSCQNSSLNPVE